MNEQFVYLITEIIEAKIRENEMHADWRSSRDSDKATEGLVKFLDENGLKFRNLSRKWV